MTDTRGVPHAPGPHRGRRHPARRARIVVAGAATAAVLAITTALGLTEHATAAPSGTGAPAAVSTPPGSGRPTTPDARPATPAPFGSARAPDATTHGSR
jgi:hypothetical protein